MPTLRRPHGQARRLAYGAAFEGGNFGADVGGDGNGFLSEIIEHDDVRTFTH